MTTFGAQILLIFAAIMQIISGGTHYIVWRKSKANTNTHNKTKEI